MLMHLLNRKPKWGLPITEKRISEIKTESKEEAENMFQVLQIKALLLHIDF